MPDSKPNTEGKSDEQKKTADVNASDQKEMERELAMIKGQLDLFSKIFPKGETKPLEGKVETKDVGFVARLVAYNAMGEIASDISGVLGNVLHDDDKVMIVTQLDFASGDLPLIEITEQFELFEKSLSAQINVNEKIQELPISKAFAMAALPVATSLLAMAGTVIPGLATLSGYFKTDYGITGYDFELDKEGLLAKVAGDLAQKGKAVYRENFYGLAEEVNKFPIIEKFAELSKLSMDLQFSKEQLLTRKDQLIERIKTSGGSAEKASADIDQAIKDSQTLLDALKSYAQSITTKATGEETPRLMRAVLRDRIRQLKITHLLHLMILPKSGGEAITKKKYWFIPDTVGYLGGASVSYILAEKEGKIISGDTLTKLSIYNYRLSAPEESILTLVPFSKDRTKSG
jgi:hypothetical protein